MKGSETANSACDLDAVVDVVAHIVTSTLLDTVAYAAAAESATLCTDINEPQMDDPTGFEAADSCRRQHQQEMSVKSELEATRRELDAVAEFGVIAAVEENELNGFKEFSNH